MTTESTLRDVLASQFDAHTVHGCLRRSDRKTVYEVAVDGQRAVCKMTDSHQAVLARERAVLDAVTERTSVPVPEVFAAGDGYLVLEFARGDTYDENDRGLCRARLRSVGRTLAHLHRDSRNWFGGHGTLNLDSRPLTVSHPTTWPDRLAAFVDDWATNLSGTRDADLGAAVVEFVDEYRHVFADCPPVLAHGEPSPDHVRFDGYEVDTLFDWEIAQSAPGEFDLAWAERDFLRSPFGGSVDSDLQAALHEGYEAERPRSSGSTFRCEVYRAAFAMRDLRLVDDAGSDDCRASMRAYVFDRLDAAESMV